MRTLALVAIVLGGSCRRVPEEPTPPRDPPKTMTPQKTMTAQTTAAAACPRDPTPSANTTLYERGIATFVTPDGTRHEFKVEIARTEDAQSRGLMYRTSLAEDAGMVFDFAWPHRASFWMENTCVPLDMVFVGEDLVVIGVVTAPPLTRDSRSVPGISAYVVELAAGVASRKGIAIGTRFLPPTRT